MRIYLQNCQDCICNIRFRMDWRAVTFDWNRARAFLVTAEEGSLSAAARALEMTQPTLGRQVAALEEELGVPLFERGGRGMALTPNGLDLLDHVRAMGEAANRLSLSASGQSTSLEGNVCITATEITAAYLLPPVVRKLRRLEPGITVEIVASNSASDLKRREADIAIRIFRPTQPDLVAKRIRGMQARLYATPGYLATLGNPRTAADLADADFLGFDRTDRFIAVLREAGLDVTSRQFPVITENHLVQWELVKQGMGIGPMVTDVGDHEPLVRPALPDLLPFRGEVWLVAHRELRTSRRIRRVFDFLAEELAEP